MAEVRNIEVVIQDDPLKNPKKTIMPETALDHVKRVHKDHLIDFYYVDENGQRIKTKVAERRDPRQIAFEALREKAKLLEIKGYLKMDEEALLQAVQKASNPIKKK